MKFRVASPGRPRNKVTSANASTQRQFGSIYETQQVLRDQMERVNASFLGTSSGRLTWKRNECSSMHMQNERNDKSGHASRTIKIVRSQLWKTRNSIRLYKCMFACCCGQSTKPVISNHVRKKSYWIGSTGALDVISVLISRSSAHFSRLDSLSWGIFILPESPFLACSKQWLH